MKTETEQKEYKLYPSYPKDFNVKKKPFSKIKYRIINEYIRRGIKEIIFEHEMGRGNDNMKFSYDVDGVTVVTLYKNKYFYTYIVEKGVKYKAEPIKCKMKFDYAKDEISREKKIREDESTKRITSFNHLIWKTDRRYFLTTLIITINYIFWLMVVYNLQ